MTRIVNEGGIVNQAGGDLKLKNVVQQVGTGDGVGPAARRESVARRTGDRADVGIVTILATEMQAVVERFGLRRERGSRFDRRYYVAPVDGRRLVAIRTLKPGSRSTMDALGDLWQRYRPALLVLVGIGGGLHTDVEVDDVVVATQVVYYDQRKEGPGPVVRRGEAFQPPAWTLAAANDFFTVHGEPAVLRSTAGRTFRVLGGPIGSGEAVIAAAENENRRYLTAYNDKTLAVDTEAGGLGEFCYGLPSGGDAPGWIVVRGISDLADETKRDDHHGSAAANAAQTLHELLPHLL